MRHSDASDLTPDEPSGPLAAIQQRTLELIVNEAELGVVLGELCKGVDALDPDLISTIMVVDPDGKRLWPVAGPRAPDGWTRMISPLPIGPVMGSCGAAAYRKEAVISADIATDPSWSGAGEEGRRIALSHGLRAAWAVPLLSKNKQLMGTFALYYTSVRRPTPDDVRLVETAARVALIAIERDRSRAALNDAIAEIKKSEAELRTIVSMIPQLVVVLAPDGTTSFVNQMMLDYAGLTASEVTGAAFVRASSILKTWNASRVREPGPWSAGSRSRTSSASGATTASTDGSSCATPRCATIRGTSCDGTPPRRTSTIGSSPRNEPGTRTRRCARRSTDRRCSRRSSGRHRRCSRCSRAWRRSLLPTPPS